MKLFTYRGFLCLFLIFVQFFVCTVAYEVSYAVNLGGSAFLDSEGIIYEADNNSKGFKQTWAEPLNLTCATEADRLLYQSSHFSELTFGYDLPVPKDGHYALILKMGSGSGAVNENVFNVQLNENHTVLSNVDRVKKGGAYTAFDEFIYFSICDRTLMFGNQISYVNNNKVRLDFKPIKNHALVCAIVLLKGNIGEKRKLSSSNSNQTMFFDPKHTPCQPRGVKETVKFQKLILPDHKTIAADTIAGFAKKPVSPYFYIQNVANLNINNYKKYGDNEETFDDTEL